MCLSFNRNEHFKTLIVFQLVRLNLLQVVHVIHTCNHESVDIDNSYLCTLYTKGHLPTIRDNHLGVPVHAMSISTGRRRDTN